ncbi:MULTISPECIES: cell division protein ZipA [Shewanella]|jgi:cell division protein ZipA|uniref:Cell division protein ZipA n=2 Tax=Gammaproteobacteria TaxID=1236 RepID=A0A3N4EK57_9GAMM|nr:MULTISPECIES: cell division protein ZipA [Shewanella]AZG36777.1 cell division protein ZipA [Shewanella psychromarinicola]MCL1081982.1 cell division protein ZipA [Shewanella psychromarinicola]PKG78020.1 cell division protein ZipA [Shewanella sp. Actino-trap-3]RPA34630.1 cell division protein ZipA [Shewanella psychromarinicola]
MKDLQLVLFVLGAIAIIAVLVHGFWSIRKQQPKSMKQSPMAGFYKDQAERTDSEGFDADGIGKVRVRKSDDIEEPVVKPILKTQLSQKSNPSEARLSDTPLRDSLRQPDPKKSKPAHVEPKAAHPTQQALFVDDEVQPEPTANVSMNTPKKIFNPSTSTAKLESYTGKPTVTKPDPIKPTGQAAVPKVDAEVDTEVDPSVNINPPADAPVNELAEPTDVLVLHIVAKEGEQIQGAELLPSLLSLNFKFGEMDIFHRHIDNAGTGKVLFSLANMLKPGIFDPDQMEQFVTQGVVLFMTLPCYGDPLMNFTIMLNSAYQIADDLGAQLLDGQRQPWSDETKKDYLRRLNAA